MPGEWHSHCCDTCGRHRSKWTPLGLLSTRGRSEPLPSKPQLWFQDTRLHDKATELRTRAERKAGQMLRESAEKGERASRKSPKAQGKHVVADDMLPPPTLAQIGVTRDNSSKWHLIAALI